MPIDLNRETIIERQVAVHEGSSYLKDQSDDVWEEAIAFFSQFQYEGGKYNPHNLARAEEFLRLNAFHVEWEAGKRERVGWLTDREPSGLRVCLLSRVKTQLMNACMEQ